MRTCKEIQLSLVEYRDQSLKEEETSQVKEHLQHCSSCDAYLKEMEKIRSMSREAFSPPESVFFEEMRRSLFERIRRSRPSKEVVVRPLRRQWAPLLVPVTLVLLILIAFPSLTFYQDFRLREDLTELALLTEMEGEEPVLAEEALLEEELALTDELLVAQAEEEDPDAWLEETLDLLNALGEEELLDEEGEETLEEEFLYLDEALVG